MGTTKSVSIVPSSIPPTITQPICWRDSAPAPVASASGSAPSTMAPVVIRIGRSRSVAGPTAPAAGLVFLGPKFPRQWNLPDAVTL